jgi:hypothetical protein
MPVGKIASESLFAAGVVAVLPPVGIASVKIDVAAVRAP